MKLLLGMLFFNKMLFINADSYQLTDHIGQKKF